jgi:broad specificity phosphatase PhoE
MRMLALVSAAATAAQRLGAFAADEGAESGALEGLHAPTLLAGDKRQRGPEQRCRETADALGLDAAPQSVLRAWDLGSWVGRTITELGEKEPEALGAWRTDPDVAPHGGESLLQLLDRVGAWMEEPSERERAIAVADASVVRACVLRALGADWHTYWRLDLPPLTVSVLTHGSGVWRVRSVAVPLR